MQSTKPAFAARLFEAVRKARRRHRDHRQLSAMSDRELSDLGVGRSQIPGLLEALSDAAAPPHARRSRAPYALDVRPAMRP